MTSRGVRRTTLAAQGIARLIDHVDLIATSPLIRAAATARILADAFGTDNLQTLDALSVDGSDRKVIEFLKRNVSRKVVALVGHEPHLGKLAATLVIGAGSLALKKAGACALRCETPCPGSAELIWFLPPALLRRLGRKKALR